MKILTAHGLIVVDASGGDRFLKKDITEELSTNFQKPLYLYSFTIYFITTTFYNISACNKYDLFYG